MFSLPPEILANWLQPGALVAGAVGGMGLLIGAFRSLRGELKDEMRAGEDRMNKRIDEVKEEMKEFKQEMGTYVPQCRTRLKPSHHRISH